MSNLNLSLNYLKQLFIAQLKVQAGQLPTFPALPELQNESSPFTQMVVDRRMTTDEFVMFATALAPHVQPYLFDEAVQQVFPQGGDLPVLGGVRGTNFRGFLPTGETLLFLLDGNSTLERRLQLYRLMGSEHFFAKEKIIALESVKSGEPMSSGRLLMDSDFVDLFTLGYVTPPRTGSNFPAQRIESQLEWSDLILSEATQKQLQEVETWIQHNNTLLHQWQMSRLIKPGFRALFFGPPGTGKTMAAGLLGKFTGHEVYRIDLSSMVSKYIGETEKNLAALFDRAENKKWILFFDEADALFGKRTGVRDAHDRFANQEVSYLLQRIEDYSGISILASNFKSNLDDAFTRRFQSVVYFPMPKPAERLRMWQQMLPAKVQLDADISLKNISEKYELSGSNIVNIIHFCCLQALAAQTDIITLHSLMSGISRELAKENKIAEK
jgi:AAA+ superfamily predicted ATPase